MQLLGFSTPSPGKARRASPLTPRSRSACRRFSTPSPGKARRASPLTPRSRSALPSVQHPLTGQSPASLPAHTSLTLGFAVGSAPPHRAKPGEPPRSHLAHARLCRRFSTPSGGIATGASPLTPRSRSSGRRPASPPPQAHACGAAPSTEGRDPKAGPCGLLDRLTCRHARSEHPEKSARKKSLDILL